VNVSPGRQQVHRTARCHGFADLPGGFFAAFAGQVVVVWRPAPALGVSGSAVNEVKGIDPAHHRRV